MYAYIEGTIAFLEEDRVVLDAGGIGYEIMVGQRDLVAMDAVGSRTRLYTYFQV
ncbi:MAG: Holliday junction branch migration protein RuvA, partial [Lachnospiraceae bacterium]|nr:Holliday junction branch migration protein RuvA [Lachnospiraceae bacterium]